MKTTYTIILMLLTFGFVQAQISEDERPMEKGTHNSLQLVIPDVEMKETRKLWKKYVKDVGSKSRAKYSRKTRTFVADDIFISSVGGDNSLDLYAKFEERGEDVAATLWFDLGGAYLNSEMHGEKYTEGEKLLMRFALLVTKEKTEEILDNEKDKQKDLEKDLSRLKKDNDGYQKDIEKAKQAIEDAKQAIKDAEANIEKNLKDQEKKKEEIEEQKGVVKSVKERLEVLEE